jgi:hypothetical protein
MRFFGKDRLAAELVFPANSTGRSALSRRITRSTIRRPSIYKITEHLHFADMQTRFARSQAAKPYLFTLSPRGPRFLTRLAIRTLPTPANAPKLTAKDFNREHG